MSTRTRTTSLLVLLQNRMDGRRNPMESDSDNKQSVESDVERHSDLSKLGDGIWLSELPDGPRLRIIAGESHNRFLDRLYLPVETHLLTENQVLVINRFRESITKSDPQFAYNKWVKEIFRSVIDATRGPVLEVGPSLEPVIPHVTPDALLCDFDNDANRLNAERGFRTVHPRDLRQAIERPFKLIFGCFVFHFGLEADQAFNLVQALDEDGVMVFNVLSKSAATRTSAISRLSQAGLCFQSVELEPLLGKRDVLFVGSKFEKASPYQIEIRGIIENLKVGKWPSANT